MGGTLVFAGDEDDDDEDRELGLEADDDVLNEEVENEEMQHDISEEARTSTQVAVGVITVWVTLKSL